jgi:hypothetical protein
MIKPVRSVLVPVLDRQLPEGIQLRDDGYDLKPENIFVRSSPAEQAWSYAEDAGGAFSGIPRTIRYEIGATSFEINWSS